MEGKKFALKRSVQTQLNTNNNKMQMNISQKEVFLQLNKLSKNKK